MTCRRSRSCYQCSIFAYCTEALRLSEHAAYHRIVAARAATRFPRILDMLGDGSLNLTTVRLLAPHLTSEKHEGLLRAAVRKSKREVEELLARHFPQPAVPASVRKLPAARAVLQPMTLTTMVPAGGADRARWPGEASEAVAFSSLLAGPPPSPLAAPAPSMSAAPAPSLPAASALLAPTPPALSPPTRPPVIRPLAPDRYEIRFTATAAICEKLRLAQDLLSHAVPKGDTAQIIDRALTVLIEDLARTKLAVTARPRAAGTAESAGSGRAARRSRHIPARVKRAVWIRNGGRCAFVARAGRRCRERAFLEFHHLDPYAAGGQATVDRIELRRGHNAYEADLYYGPRQPAGEASVGEPRVTYGRRRLGPDRVGSRSARSRRRDQSIIRRIDGVEAPGPATPAPWPPRAGPS